MSRQTIIRQTWCGSRELPESEFAHKCPSLRDVATIGYLRPSDALGQLGVPGHCRPKEIQDPREEGDDRDHTEIYRCGRGVGFMVVAHGRTPILVARNEQLWHLFHTPDLGRKRIRPKSDLEGTSGSISKISRVGGDFFL
jgi:hypothetical protein